MDDFLFNLIFQHLMWIPWVRPRETELQAWYRHSDICLRKTQLPKNWSQGLTNFQSHYFLRNCFAHSWFGPLLANQTIADWLALQWQNMTFLWFCRLWGSTNDQVNDFVFWWNVNTNETLISDMKIIRPQNHIWSFLHHDAKPLLFPCSFEQLRSCHDRMSWQNRRYRRWPFWPLTRIL